MASQESKPAESAYRRCPICSEPTDADFRPFCSARCRDVDLSRWLKGGYAIPGGHADADEDGEDTVAGRGMPPGDGKDDPETT
jgi:uncharacterized protein